MSCVRAAGLFVFKWRLLHLHSLNPKKWLFLEKYFSLEGQVDEASIWLYIHHHCTWMPSLLGDGLDAFLEMGRWVTVQCELKQHIWHYKIIPYLMSCTTAPQHRLQMPHLLDCLVHCFIPSVFSTILLRYDQHTKSCAYVMYTTWWVWK